MMCLIFLEDFGMKKVFTKLEYHITFADGCELYPENCKQRNLREGTINHYRQSYTQFYKFFDPDNRTTAQQVVFLFRVPTYF